MHQAIVLDIGSGQGGSARAGHIVNGVQDSVVGVLNIGLGAVNAIAWAEERLGILNPEDPIRVPYIPSPDWSRGLITHEAGQPGSWTDTHGWSKFFGATGVEFAAGAWAAKASKVKQAVGGVQQLGRGSTANLAKGSTLARNLREQLAIEQALANPKAGRMLKVKMTDPRWPASEGWVKMQQMIYPGGEPIEVHYLYNTVTGAVDDAKIILRGPRPR